MLGGLSGGRAADLIVAVTAGDDVDAAVEDRIRSSPRAADDVVVRFGQRAFHAEAGLDRAFPPAACRCSETCSGRCRGRTPAETRDRRERGSSSVAPSTRGQRSELATELGAGAAAVFVRDRDRVGERVAGRVAVDRQRVRLARRRQERVETLARVRRDPGGAGGGSARAVRRRRWRGRAPALQRSCLQPFALRARRCSMSWRLDPTSTRSRIRLSGA